MNVREYFENEFSHKADLAILERVHPSSMGDAVTFGTILAEMPVDSTCGDDCRKAIDAAKGMHRHITAAFGRDMPRLIETNLYTAARVCSCYIRG